MHRWAFVLYDPKWVIEILLTQFASDKNQIFTYRYFMCATRTALKKPYKLLKIPLFLQGIDLEKSHRISLNN